jgi:hypothetical protein
MVPAGHQAPELRKRFPMMTAFSRAMAAHKRWPQGAVRERAGQGFRARRVALYATRFASSVHASLHSTQTHRNPKRKWAPPRSRCSG